VDEAVDGALREQGLVEGGEPLGGVAVAGDDRGCASRALDDELVDVTALVAGHGLEREVVDDEEVDRGQLRDHRLSRVVEAALLEAPQHRVGPREDDVVAVARRDVAEGVREKGLADTDGSEDDDVLARVDEAQAHELCEHALVVADLRRRIPALQRHVGVEPRLVRAPRAGRALASCDFVREHEQQRLIERETLLVGEHDALRERREDRTELQLLQHRLDLGRHGRRLHRAPSLRVANRSLDLAKRGGPALGSVRSLPSSLARSSPAIASLSMRSMRGTSITSKSSARLQSASTRASPCRSQSRTSAYPWRIVVHGSGPPSSRCAGPARSRAPCATVAA